MVARHEGGRTHGKKIAGAFFSRLLVTLLIILYQVVLFFVVLVATITKKLTTSTTRLWQGLSATIYTSTRWKPERDFVSK